MKKALVLGASGGMGSAIVFELAERGTDTVAFARREDKLHELFNGNPKVTITTGNALVYEDVKKAADGVDVIFHAVNFPYQDWEKKYPPLLDVIMKVAKEVEAKVAVVDNIYSYGKSNGNKVTEAMNRDPHTKKGKFRLRMERLMMEANSQGTPFLIAHFPDFYGPFAENTLLHVTLEKVVKNKSALFVGDQSIKREYIYTPDGAKALVELAKTEDAYGQNWNIPGAGVISCDEIIEIARNVTPFTKKVSTVGRGKLALVSLFNAGLREFKELMYLIEEPVVLCGKRYESNIGELPKTPYEEGLRKTIEYYQNKQSKSVSRK